MSYDILSTSSINSLIDNYIYSEEQKSVVPLQDRKTRYSNISTGYTNLTSKLDQLSTLLEDLKETGSGSTFRTKGASSSNEDLISATSSSSASSGSFTLKVGQLAKSDIALSQDFNASDTNALTGTHTFQIKTGDGEGGEFVSNVEVEFEAGETNDTALEKIKDAINSDKAIVNSAELDSSTLFTGSGEFVIDIEDTETTIEYDYSNQSWDTVIDDLVDQINTDVDGVTASKVVDGSNVSLKIEVNNRSDYITIDSSTDTGSLLGGANLDLNVIQEKSSAGLVTASQFDPTSATTQLSLTAVESGLDYRITDISDTNGGTALGAFGLNLGSSRPTYDQTPDPDTAGFIYADITDANNQLNSKFEFNGIDIARNSNAVSDLVTGTTFTLKSVMDTGDDPVTITVENDSDHIQSKLQEFVDKFNDIYTYIKNNSSSGAGIRGIFFGDANASSLLSAFRTTAYSNVQGISDDSINKLSEIGISFSAYTGLSISDSTLLEQKIQEDASQIETLFNSTNGVATSLYDAIDPFLGADGYLASSKDSVDRNVTRLRDKIDSMNDRIDQSAEVMRSKYEELQMQLMQFYSMQSTMSSYFSSGGGYF